MIAKSKNIFCAIYIFTTNVFYWNLNPTSWERDYRKFVRARHGFECRLTWLLIRAIKFRDPYMISKAFKALRGKGGGYFLNLNAAISILESLAWVKDPDVKAIEYDFCSRESLSEKDLELYVNIVSWRYMDKPLAQFDVHQVNGSIYGLGWPLSLLRAVVLEGAKKLDSAEQSYRTALNSMPNWIPEAKNVYDKLNYLINNKGQL